MSALKKFFLPVCNICKKTEVLDFDSTCNRCAVYFSEAELNPNGFVSKSELPVFSFWKNINEIQDLLITQKNEPSPAFVEGAVRLILKYKRLIFEKEKLISIPTSPFKIHLLDHLILKLDPILQAQEKLNFSFFINPFFFKSNKLMNKNERYYYSKKKWDPVFKKYNLTDQKIVLLDDIMTTGATLLSIKNTLESNGCTVVGGIVLAHTPIKN